MSCSFVFKYLFIVLKPVAQKLFSPKEGEFTHTDFANFCIIKPYINC